MQQDMLLRHLREYAEHCAEIIGVKDTIWLRWKVIHPECAARCHTDDQDRGTIDLNYNYFVVYSGDERRYVIAHEVCHLATANHSSYAFQALMEKLDHQKWPKPSQPHNATIVKTLAATTSLILSGLLLTFTLMSDWWAGLGNIIFYGIFLLFWGALFAAPTYIILEDRLLSCVDCGCRAGYFVNGLCSHCWYKRYAQDKPIGETMQILKSQDSSFEGLI